MGAVTLDTGEIVAIDVETQVVDEPVTSLEMWFDDGEVADPETGAVSQLIYLNRPEDVLHDLHAAHAPMMLIDEATPVLAGQVATTHASARNLLTNIVSHFRGIDDAEIVDRRRVYRRVPVVAAGAPSSADAKVHVEVSASASREAGFELKFGGFGLASKVRYTISTTPKLECDAGAAKIASLYVPLDQVTSMVRPEGGYERFPVVRYEPIADLRRFGAVTTLSLAEELLEGATGEWAPLGGPSETTQGSVSERIDISSSLEIGRKWGDQQALSLTAELSGTATLKVDYSLPAADAGYVLSWLNRPAGVCVYARAV